MRRAAVAVLAGGLHVACGSGPTARAPTPFGRRTMVAVGLGAAPASLDPHRVNEFLTFNVLSNVCEGLVALGPWLRVEGALAQSWTNPDDRHWRFELRPGVLFHDGRPLTPEDVVFSLERARRLQDSQYASYLVDVEEVRASGKHAVEITTARPNPLLLQKLAFVLIVPRGAPDEIKEPVGTGPYSLTVQDSGRTIVLRAFPGHWGPAPSESEVHFVTVPRPEACSRLLSGELDLMLQLTPDEAGRVSATAGFRVVAGPSPSVDVLSLRVDAAPFDDPRVRRAVHLALDRETLVAEMLQGYGRPASQLVNRNVFGFDPELRVPARDLGEARRLLAEAGRPDGLDFELEHRRERSVDSVVRQLAEAGLRARPVGRHWHELLDRFEKRQVAVGLMGLVSDSGESSDVLISTLHTRSREGGFGDSNDRGYSNPELDALIETASQTPRLGARQRLLQQCMGIAMKDLSLIPLVERYLIYGVREELIVEPRADGRILARDLRRLPLAR